MGGEQTHYPFMTALLRRTLSRAEILSVRPEMEAGIPLPTFAATLRQPTKPDDAHERDPPWERQARVQWAEQSRLLRQRLELLARGTLPKAAPSEKELFEVLQPFLDATAALERARTSEASNLWSDLRRAKQATARFHELVLHVGSGPDFVSQVQEAMEGAEARLRSLRECHDRRAAELHEQELALTQELEVLGRCFDGPVPEEPPAAPGTDERPRRRPAAMAAVDGDGGADSGGGDSGGGDVRAQIASIEEQLAQLGGVGCGWAEEEHAAFLRLRAKLLGSMPDVTAALVEAAAAGEQSIKMAAFRSRVREAVAKMAGLLDGVDEAAVAEHEASVQQRELGLHKKKELLHAWRQVSPLMLPLLPSRPASYPVPRSDLWRTSSLRPPPDVLPPWLLADLPLEAVHGTCGA